MKNVVALHWQPEAADPGRDTRRGPQLEHPKAPGPEYESAGHSEQNEPLELRVANWPLGHGKREQSLRGSDALRLYPGRQGQLAWSPEDVELAGQAEHWPGPEMYVPPPHGIATQSPPANGV